MLRPVVSSNNDPIYHKFDPAELLSHQMFRQAMGQVCPEYQVIELTVSAPEPTVSEKLEAMEPRKKKESIHDERLGVVTLKGKMIISRGEHEFECICTMYNRRWAWESHSVALTIATQSYFFKFRLFSGFDFSIYKADGLDNEGPQPAKI